MLEGVAIGTVTPTPTKCRYLTLRMTLTARMSRPTCCNFIKVHRDHVCMRRSLSNWKHSQPSVSAMPDKLGHIFPLVHRSTRLSKTSLVRLNGCPLKERHCLLVCEPSRAACESASSKAEQVSLEDCGLAPSNQPSLTPTFFWILDRRLRNLIQFHWNWLPLRLQLPLSSTSPYLGRELKEEELVALALDRDKRANAELHSGS